MISLGRLAAVTPKANHVTFDYWLTVRSGHKTNPHCCHITLELPWICAIIWIQNPRLLLTYKNIYIGYFCNQNRTKPRTCVIFYAEIIQVQQMNFLYLTVLLRWPEYLGNIHFWQILGKSTVHPRYNVGYFYSSMHIPNAWAKCYDIHEFYILHKMTELRILAMFSVNPCWQRGPIIAPRTLLLRSDMMISTRNHSVRVSMKLHDNRRCTD